MARSSRVTPVSTFTETNRDNLRSTAFHGASATMRAVELLRTIGEKTFRKHEDELRDDFKAGYVAGCLAPKGADNLSADLLKQAVAILAKPNAKASKPDRRTEAQEAAVSAAKVAWSRVLERAGLASSSAKAGNKNAKRTTTGDKPEEPAKPETTETTPRAYSKGDVISHVTRQADTLWAFIQKNAKQCPIGISRAVADFRTALKALDADGMLPAPAPVKPPVISAPIINHGTAASGATH